uniref:Homing endonuclease n=1 Tax=viral metagenome TaxID=1070528 RepID=A0A6M3J0I0_9ZZZZ
MRADNPLKLNDLRIEDLYWIAGFLEGEGTFCRCGGTIQISASQVQKEPVEKLYKLLGGFLAHIERKNVSPKWNNYWRWGAYGETAELCMKAIFSLMSTKRKNKISEVLSWYASRPGRNFAKSGRKTCRKSLHQWNDANTYVDSRGMKTCRLCREIAYQNRRLIFN